MPKSLEVIVTSVHEAREAERGGADRLELVRDLANDGFTPSIDLVRNVVSAVSIPVRVILRDRIGFTAQACDLTPLRARIEELWGLGVDGLVLGFIDSAGIEARFLRTALQAAPDCRVTFHRAFDEVPDPRCALEQLRQIPQIDRVLTSGGAGTPEERSWRLAEWQQIAGPNLAILAGGGLDAESLKVFVRQHALHEFHVGRAARIPATPSGAVRRFPVSCLRSILG